MFFLTREDKSLSLSLSGRDPLGTQAIWQWRARDVVPALTAASRQAEGFQLLLTALSWWPNFAKRYSRPSTDLKRYFLLVEQAFARACKTAQYDWPLPGNRRLSGNEAGVWIGLDAQRHFLISNPLTNGTWGLYRGPLLNARLIDAANFVTDSSLDEAVRYGTGVVEELFPYLNRALNEPQGADEVLAQRASKAIVQGLVEVLRGLPLRAKLKEKLVTPKGSPITGELAKIALEEAEETVDALVLRSLGRLEDPHQNTMTKLVRCERYVAVLDASFEELCARVLTGEASPEAGLSVDMDELRSAQEVFRESGDYGGLALARRNQLLNAPTNNGGKLATFLLEHHCAVSEARGAAPWLSKGDNGRLNCRIEIAPPPRHQLQPATAWRNSYYLDALRTLAGRVGAC